MIGIRNGNNYQCSMEELSRLCMKPKDCNHRHQGGAAAIVVASLSGKLRRVPQGNWRIDHHVHALKTEP